MLIVVIQNVRIKTLHNKVLRAAFKALAGEMKRELKMSTPIDCTLVTTGQLMSMLLKLQWKSIQDGKSDLQNCMGRDS